MLNTDKPVIVAGSKPLLTEIGINHGWIGVCLPISVPNCSYTLSQVCWWYIRVVEVQRPLNVSTSKMASCAINVLLTHQNVTVRKPGVGTISLPCVSEAVWISMGCEELQQLSRQTGRS